MLAEWTHVENQQKGPEQLIHSTVLRKKALTMYKRIHWKTT